MSDQLNEFSTEQGCPKCGSPLVEKVKYTWWGGLIGPKLLHHTKCAECKYTYNSKTRQSNTTGIVIYSIVLFAIAFAVFFALRSR
jgi:transposase-like protein